MKKTLFILMIVCLSSYGQVTNETVTDVEGNVYHTVKIGTQTWMVENLKVTRYASGEQIVEIKNPDSWSTSDAAYCWYDNDIFFKNTYGALYNYYIIQKQEIGGKRFTPKGWHVPSVEEWQTLINYLGGEQIAGAKMKETGIDHWISSNVETTNESGFTALSGGYRLVGITTADCIYVGESGMFWSSTKKNMFTAWCYLLKNGKNEIVKLPKNTNNGYSIRCIKD